MACCRLRDGFRPGTRAVDDQRLEQDNQLALSCDSCLVCLNAAPKNGISPRTGGACDVLGGRLLHQAADHHDLTTDRVHDAVGLTDRRLRRRQALLLAVDRECLGLILHIADRGMDMQGNPAAVIDLRRDIQRDTGKEGSQRHVR